MKSSYELAMERLNKAAPATKLSPGQKKQIAELESKCKARIAERELALKGEIEAAAAAGEFEKVEALRLQLVVERKKLQSELEEKKEQIHQMPARK
jgi:hypothetical protein